MQKINLEALESKNMTAVSEDTLSEINGGCTFKLKTSYACSRSYTYWDRVKSCGGACPLDAVKFVKKNYAEDAKKMEVSRDQGSVAGWIVDVKYDAGGSYAYRVSNNGGKWFGY